MAENNNGYLAHYGVKGQKWGNRQWQNEDGTYTEAGKQRYGWGDGRQQTAAPKIKTPRPRMAQTTTAPRRTAGAVQQRRPARTYSDAQRRAAAERLQQGKIKAARKRKVKKILIAAGVTAVVAAAAYGAYKGSTKLRDDMRTDVFNNMNTDSNKIRTINSKYWDAADRSKFTEMSRQRAQDTANSITRRDAVYAKLQEKTGIKISAIHSREHTLAARRSENNYANFIRDAEKRGSLNRSIHDARAELREREQALAKYRSIEKIGTSKEYEQFWIRNREDQIQQSRERLQGLLMRRRAG